MIITISLGLVNAIAVIIIVAVVIAYVIKKKYGFTTPENAEVLLEEKNVTYVQENPVFLGVN